MSKQTEALKLALEALEQWNTPLYKRGNVITALRRALAVSETHKQPAYRAVKTVHEGKAYYVSEPEQQPAPATELREQQEPVAWMWMLDGEVWDLCSTKDRFTPIREGHIQVPLYTRPQKPAQDELVAWPAGLIDRIKAAEQRIQDGHAPRRIPADPTDVDLVLAEVRHLLEGKRPPFWVDKCRPQAREPLLREIAALSANALDDYKMIQKLMAERQPLTDEEILTYRHMIDWTAEWSYINFARAIEAAHGIGEKK